MVRIFGNDFGSLWAGMSVVMKIQVTSLAILALLLSGAALGMPSEKELADGDFIRASDCAEWV